MLLQNYENLPAQTDWNTTNKYFSAAGINFERLKT